MQVITAPALYRDAEPEPQAASGWITKPIHLHYFISDFRVMKMKFQAMVLTRSLDPWSPADADPQLPLAEFPEGVEVLFSSSYPICAPLERTVRLRNCIRYVPRQYQNVYVDLSSSFDDYLKAFSTKSRTTLRRKIRKFMDASGGKIDWRQFHLPGEMETFQRLAREVAEKTYQERLFRGGLPSTPAFLENMQSLAERDSVRAFLLSYQEKPIAYLYCPVQDGVLRYDFVGHDPQFNELSPGTVLLCLALQSLFQECKFRLFNFGQAGVQQKNQFSTGQVYCADIYYFRPTLRNRLLIAVHTATERFSKMSGDALERLGIKSVPKKLMRARL